MASSRKLVHGSTFSGIGAPEIAAEMLGWTNAFYCEINPFGRSVLDYYFPNAESYEDITKTDFSKWRGKIDVLTGGFPCQPFSYAGKRRGSEDDRYLWPFMLRCIQQIRPTWFIGENVSGITTMVFPGQDVKVASGGTIFEQTEYMARDERYIIEEICQQLEDIRYSVQPMLIPACAVGAPHRRDRVFFVAHRNVADTDSERQPSSTMQDRRERQTMDEQCENESLTGTCRHGSERPTTDTKSKQGIGYRLEQRETCLSKSSQFRGGDCKDDYFLPENRWRAFPTVTPVYRGNDGFPFHVDDLTIPFSEWKRESLKAYGNAIVPQVMYEIFRGIDEIEKTRRNHENDYS